MKILVSCAIALTCFFQFKTAMLFVPVSIVDVRSQTIGQLVETYDISKKMATAVWNAHLVSGYDPVLIAELAFSESSFNNNVVSPKGYKGVLQTPTKTGYLNADMVHGVEILREKFKLYKKPLPSLAAYKGGKDVPLARVQASKVLAAYKARKGGME